MKIPFDNKSKIGKVKENWTNIVHEIQATETALDSASQRLIKILGADNLETRKVIQSLKSVRRIQSRYFPIQERSLKRYYDSVDSSGNYKPHLSKQNYPKYKRQRDIQKGKQAVIQ